MTKASPAQRFKVLRLRVKHWVVCTYINIKAFVSIFRPLGIFVLGKKGLHQLFFNPRLVAELLDMAGGEVGTALHGQGIKEKKEASIISGAKNDEQGTTGPSRQSPHARH